MTPSPGQFTKPHSAACFRTIRFTRTQDRIIPYQYGYHDTVLQILSLRATTADRADRYPPSHPSSPSSSSATFSSGTPDSASWCISVLKSNA